MEAYTENRKARHDYAILETYEAGLELRGPEVKSITSKQASLDGAYAIIRGNEAFLINFTIPPYQPNNTPPNYDAERPKRLLLKADEIKYLIGKIQGKLTLVPLKLYNKNGKIKVLLGLARSRKKKDERELLKKKAWQREMRKGS